MASWAQQWKDRVLRVLPRVVPRGGTTSSLNSLTAGRSDPGHFAWTSEVSGNTPVFSAGPCHGWWRWWWGLFVCIIVCGLLVLWPSTWSARRLADGGESGRSGSLAFVSSGWKAVCLPLSPLELWVTPGSCRRGWKPHSLELDAGPPAKQACGLYPQKLSTSPLRSQGITGMKSLKTISSGLSPTSQCVPQ